jgi:HemY protein
VRSLFWLVAVFAAAVALALFGRLNEGIAVFVVPPWRLEISLLLFALGAAAAFGLLYAALRLLRHTLALPAQVRAYRERRRREHAHAALAAALQAWFEGRYTRAEKEATIAWEAGSAPGLAALVAARAAHELREYERRDRWLDRAEEAGGESLRAARLLSQAELALDERDFTGARNALKSLHGTGPRHVATARMLLRAERGAQNWDEVLKLATSLAKRDAISLTIAEEYRVQAHIELLARAAGDRASLESRWARIPANDQAHPRVAGAAARHAAAAGDAALARRVLERALAAEWSPALVALYGDLPQSDAHGPEVAEEARTRLERAEKWLAGHADDPRLLVTLGRLCAQAGLWGKARDYLEASLSFEKSRGAHLELARLAERDGRAADAQRHFRSAAELA